MPRTVQSDGRTVSNLLWAAANNPPGQGSRAGACRICGLAGVGVPFLMWVRDTFTDWDKLQEGQIICHACQFCFSERSSLLASKVGKVKPQRMRNYSHFVVRGQWIPLGKGDKAKMTQILLNESPEVAVVAESGQKHIVFRAVPGTVQFEEQQILDVSHLLELLVPIETLYSAGFRKQTYKHGGRIIPGEIDTGCYEQHKILRTGVDLWRDNELLIRPYRGSALFDLAIFLAQKGEVHGGDAPDGSELADSDLEGDIPGVQEPLPF